MAENQTLVELAKNAARNAGIPESLFLGLIRQESAWNPNAKSRAGALGLAQVMPWWAPKFGLTVSQLLDPKTNLETGAEILRQELARYKGSWGLAAMAYNAGAVAVSKAIVAAKSTDPEKVSEYLPAAETRAYWRKVLNYASYYAGLVGEAEATIGAATEQVTETAKAAIRSIPGGALALVLALGLGALLLMGGRRG
jgi:soluble lytic murein transglycosylase-like protein